MMSEHKIKAETLQAVISLGNPTAVEVALLLNVNKTTVRSRIKSLVQLNFIVPANTRGTNVSRYSASQLGLDAASTGIFTGARAHGESVNRPFLTGMIHRESRHMPIVQAAIKYQPCSVFDYAARLAV